jgi:hypothetical protein
MQRPCRESLCDVVNGFLSKSMFIGNVGMTNVVDHGEQDESVVTLALPIAH